MESKLKVKVIIGSTRPNRFSEKPANWIYGLLKATGGVEAELLDLRDYPLPFFDNPNSPSMSGGVYPNSEVSRWAAKIKEADAFVIVSPEYNHGYSAVLKNALDSIYPEWNKKAVGFVGYGGAGGARAIEQLQSVVLELQMVPIRQSLRMGWDVVAKVMPEKVPVNPELFSGLKPEPFIKELLAMAGALKSLRETK
jgi:NAD(P)H-dependent FMN reductase